MAAGVKCGVSPSPRGKAPKVFERDELGLDLGVDLSAGAGLTLGWMGDSPTSSMTDLAEKSATRKGQNAPKNKRTQRSQRGRSERGERRRRSK